MTDARPDASEADLERLAARLAMLAAEDGEADNAGRAVGAMARRIGLTGGDLKRIFLTGAGALGGPGSEQREAELAALRRNMQNLDADARRAAWERDVLRAENGKLNASLERLRAAVRHWAIGGAGLLGLMLFAGGIAWLGSGHAPHPAPSPYAADQSATVHRNAMVRPGGARLFREPESAGIPLSRLPAGQHLTVRRLVWKSLFQWAEVDLPGGGGGYVLTTDIDLS